MTVKYHTLFYILSSWVVTKSTSAQKKASIKMDIPLNEAVELECGHINETIVSVIWQTAPQNKTLRTVYSNDSLNNKKNRPPTYTNSRIIVSGKSSIKIGSTQMTDRGIWECNVIILKNGVLDNQLMSTYDINIISKPSPVTVETNKLDVIKNGHASAYCDSQSPSSFSLFWERVKGNISDHVSFKNEYSIKDDLHINRVYIYIKNIDEKDAGDYKCTAKNLAGYASEIVTVKLKSMPIISTQKKFMMNMYTDGQLKCSAKGYPNIDFTWEIPKKLPLLALKIKPLESIDRYKVLQTTIDIDTDIATSVLQIKNVQRSDMSFFKCCAQNDMGKTEIAIEVSGLKTPEAPIVVKYTVSKHSVTLYLKLGDDGGSPVNLVTIQYRKNSSETWNEASKKKIKKELTYYTINNLSENVNYTFRVSASNAIGTSEYNKFFIAIADGIQTSSIHGNIGSDIKLTLIVIIGGVIAGVFCIGVIIALFMKKTCRKEFNLTNNERDSTIRSILPTTDINSVELESIFYDSDEWEFPREKLVITSVLGAGAFGIVMSGIARGIEGTNDEVKVAVKIVRDHSNEAAKKDLLAELNLLKMIPEHENVIRLLGCCTRQDPLYVIVEFCANGDLQGLLRSSRGIYERYYKTCYGGSVPSLTSKMLLKFALQICKGMSQLSSMKVIHRDLAARNVLVDENLICKVSDFGFARDIYEDDHYLKRSAGGRFPIKWMAIESLLDNISTTKSDVWSFGVVVWELITLGASPYPGMNSYEVVSFLQDGKRMDKPKHCSNELYKIVLDCWNPSPLSRPSFMELVLKFQKLVDESETKEFIDMNFYQDHLYVNFDATVSTSASSSSYIGTPHNSLGRNRINVINTTVRQSSNPMYNSTLPGSSPVVPERARFIPDSNPLQTSRRPSNNENNIEDTEFSERRDTGRSTVSRLSETTSLLPKV
ncbi:fibroblast growth factor receptor 1 isoform X2 [Hydra vulgaris]|uniref:fibroblast growth factor receptor 1 isoform X2 n=1 Tax=Hydra vulgaris TaxID=6087 RepID=UPI0006416C18|nr:fibroblast growth factor receptor 1 isoform X1 [Hydra vulgaris]